MAANSKYLCNVSQSLKVLDALNDNNHRRYDYKVASEKKGYRLIINRLMIKEFIENNNITDVKESQIRYELGKTKKRMIERNVDESNLLTVAYVQKKKETNDRVYIFNEEVLMMVCELIRARMNK